MLRAVGGVWQAVQGLARRVRGRLSQREPPLARARVGGVDRRPLRVPDRRLRLRVRRRRREGGRSRLPRPPHPGGAHRAVRRACSATATRASVSCSARTSRGSSSSAPSAVGVLRRRDPWVVYGLAIAATIATTPFRSAQAALTPTLARTPGGADRRERRRERRREHRRLRRSGACGRPARRREHRARLPDHRAAHRRLDALPPPHPRREGRAAAARARRVDDRRRAARRLHDARHATASLARDDGPPHGTDGVVRSASRSSSSSRRSQLLDLGDGGVGYLNAAIGVGAFIGAVGALSLTGARRLSPAFLVGSS